MINIINNKFSILLAERLLKISEIAKETVISRTTLTNLYYRRTDKISFDVLNKLCKYLNCNVQDIFEYKEELNEPITKN